MLADERRRSMQGRYIIKDINFARLDKDRCYVKLEKLGSGTKRIKLTDVSQATSFDSESDAKIFIINELIIGHDHLILPKDRVTYEIVERY